MFKFLITLYFKIYKISAYKKLIKTFKFFRRVQVLFVYYVQGSEPYSGSWRQMWKYLYLFTYIFILIYSMISYK